MKTRNLNQAGTHEEPGPADPSKNNPLHEVLEIRQKRILSVKRNSRLFMGIGFCLSFLFVISAFNFKILETDKPITLNNGDLITSTLPDIKNTVYETPPPPKVQFPKIKEVDNSVQTSESPKGIDVSYTENMKPEEPVITPALPGPPVEKTDELILFPETQAQPVGGLEAFYEYLGKNIKYPKMARQLDIEGKVFLQFIVEKDGTLKDIKVIKGIGGGCDEEAVRVLSLAPKWNPGKQRGVPVRVQMSLPIVFKLRR